MYNKFKMLLMTAVAAGVIITPEVPLAAEQEEPLRDPTRPLSYSAPAEKQITLALQAIFTGKGRKEAIINGLAVSEGDSIGSARIVRIEDKQVRYVLDGQTGILRLRPSVTTATGAR